MGAVLRTEYKNHSIELSKEYDDLPWHIYIKTGLPGVTLNIHNHHWENSQDKTIGQALDEAIRIIDPAYFR